MKKTMIMLATTLLLTVGIGGTLNAPISNGPITPQTDIYPEF